MSNIPVHLQRKFEQRWAARFARPVPPKSRNLKGQQRQIAASAKSKEETRRVEAAGSKPLSSAGPEPRQTRTFQCRA
jgi:hypothetical protein